MCSRAQGHHGLSLALALPLRLSRAYRQLLRMHSSQASLRLQRPQFQHSPGPTTCSGAARYLGYRCCGPRPLLLSHVPPYSCHLHDTYFPEVILWSCRRKIHVYRDQDVVIFNAVFVINDYVATTWNIFRRSHDRVSVECVICKSS